ncbi:MAG: dipicolinate synthase subunit DpsA [Bacillota bacterium]
MNRANKKVAILGGDFRETVLMDALIKKGFSVVAGARDRDITPESIEVKEDITEVLKDAQALILPMTALQKNNRIYTISGKEMYLKEEDLALLPQGAPVLVGVANDFLKEAAEKYSLNLLAMANDNAIAIPNAMATAEGAIALAITESPLLLAKSIGIIIGYGKVGKALALRLQALGMQLIVVDKEKEALVEAQKSGFSVMQKKFCPDIADQIDFIFNTAPAPTITPEIINKLKKHTLILDIASSPGGTDFEAAKARGIKAILASGLPGKYSPYFIGQILTKVYVPIIEKKLAKGVEVNEWT